MKNGNLVNKKVHLVEEHSSVIPQPCNIWDQEAEAWRLPVPGRLGLALGKNKVKYPHTHTNTHIEKEGVREREQTKEIHKMHYEYIFYKKKFFFTKSTCELRIPLPSFFSLPITPSICPIFTNLLSIMKMLFWNDPSHS